MFKDQIKFVKKIFKTDTVDSSKELKWYQFRQNNSGGSFVQNDSIGTYVLIQAYSAEEANDLAENKAGIYFNGCDDGLDCSCCGDRWYRAYSSDKGDKEPVIYDTPVEDYFSKQRDVLSSFFHDTAVVYYFDGTKIVYEDVPKEKKVQPAKPKLARTKIATPKEVKPKVKKLPKRKSL